MRWIIVSLETGKSVGPKTSFATKRLAEVHCGPDERAVPVDLSPDDPFSNRREYGLGYMQGRGAA